YNRAIGFDQRALGFVQTKKDAALLEKSRLRRIQILRDLRIRFEKSPAKRDHFPNVAADRENDPAAKPVVHFVSRPFFVARLDQTALQQLGARVTTLQRPFQETVPTVRRETELPILSHRLVDSTLLQVFARRFGELLFQKIIVKPICGLRVQLEQSATRFVLS